MMNIPNKLKEVINTLADMHDIETDKNYPEEKCLACICQEELQEIIDYIVQQSLSGSDDKSSSPKSCRTCCHNYEDDTKPPCANCFGFVNWERHDF